MSSNIPTGKGYSRLAAFPLDESSLFATLADAEDYAEIRRNSNGSKWNRTRHSVWWNRKKLPENGCGKNSSGKKCFKDEFPGIDIHFRSVLVRILRFRCWKIRGIIIDKASNIS